MKIQKKAQFNINQAVVIILIVGALFVLVMFASSYSKKQNKDLPIIQCKSQLALASQGQPVGFSDCYSFRLDFGSESAKKYVLSEKINSKPFHEYNYDSVLKKLKEKNILDKNVEIKDKLIPEEVVYSILAEEIKFCFDTYSVDKMKTFTRMTMAIGDNKKSSTMCQPCSMVMFSDDFNLAENSKLSVVKLNSFLSVTPIKDSLSYLEYFFTNYKFLADVDNPLMQKDAYITTDQIYSIRHIYESLPEEVEKITQRAEDGKLLIDELKYFMAPEHYFVKSSHVALMNQDYVFDVCNCELNAAPKTITGEIDGFDDFMNEEILYLI